MLELAEGNVLLPRYLVSVYLLLIAAIVLFRNREGGSAFQAPPPSDGESAPSIEVALTPEEVLTVRCASLAEQYGLTPRERDIFPLLAQGHTMPAISERLFVSENTVKSHAKRIFCAWAAPGSVPASMAAFVTMSASENSSVGEVCVRRAPSVSMHQRISAATIAPTWAKAYTVKSHAKRIYQKLGIHARAELIDLVNRAGDEDAAREQ